MSRKGWILFAAMCLLWGIPYLFIKVAVEEVSVPVVVFARTAIGAVLLLPLALRSGQFGVLRRHWRPLVAFAALEITPEMILDRCFAGFSPFTHHPSAV